MIITASPPFPLPGEVIFHQASHEPLSPIPESPDKEQPKQQFPRPQGTPLGSSTTLQVGRVATQLAEDQQSVISQTATVSRIVLESNYVELMESSFEKIYDIRSRRRSGTNSDIVNEEVNLLNYLKQLNKNPETIALLNQREFLLRALQSSCSIKIVRALLIFGLNVNAEGALSFCKTIPLLYILNFLVGHGGDQFSDEELNKWTEIAALLIRCGSNNCDSTYVAGESYEITLSNGKGIPFYRHYEDVKRAFGERYEELVATCDSEFLERAHPFCSNCVIL